MTKLARPAGSLLVTTALAAVALLAAAAPAGAAAAVPGPPRSVTATAGDAKATVHWVAPTSSGGSAITAYRATCTSGGGPTGTASVGGTVLTATVTGLLNGASYTCTVTATNGSGNGPASSASAAFVPVGPPSAPRSVGAATKAGTLTVSWQAPASTGGKPITGYPVVCTSTDGGAKLTGSAPGTAKSLALTGLPDNRTYSCAVTATGPGGTSPAGTSPYVQHAKVTAAVSSTAMHLPVTLGRSISATVVKSSLTDCNAVFTLYNPDNSYLSSTCGTTAGFIDGSAVQGGGTATAVLSSGNGTAGTADLVAYVFSTVTGTITAGGPAVTTTTTVPGQNAELTFTGTAGKMISIVITGNTIASGGVNLLDPSGSYVTSVGLGGSTAFVDTVTLTSTGAYRVVADPYDRNTGKLTVQINIVPANTGSITVGTPLTVTASSGQNPTRTFTSAAGKQVALVITGNTIASGGLSLLSTDGSYLGSVGLGGPTAFLDTVTLPSNGTYTLKVDPYDQNAGKLTLKLVNVAPNTGTITPGGAAVTVTAALGQNPTRTFTSTAGKQVALRVSGNTISSGGIYLYDPNGDYVGSIGLGGPTAFLDTVTLPLNGTYTIKVDPYDQNAGKLTLALIPVAPNAGAITIGGAPVTVTAALGQNPTRTFKGTAGKTVTLDVTGNTIPSGAVYLYGPDGGYLTSVGLGGPTATLADVTLPSTGTYTLTVDPYDQNTGKLTLKLHT